MRWKTVLMLVLVWPSLSPAATVEESMSIAEAIEVLRADGVHVSYSTRLVRPDMYVHAAPTREEPIEALAEILNSHSLELSLGRRGRYLVVRSNRPAAEPDDRQDQLLRDAPTSRAIDNVVVVGSQHRLFDRDGLSRQFLSGEEIELVPHLADDSFRAIHILPGVAANDFQAPFNLRGGHLSETGVRINGMEIIDPYHMRTLFRPLSIIDPGIIGEAQLVSGGMTAETGRYLSGMVNIETDRLDTHAQHEIGVSFLTAVARSKGWFADGRGDYHVSIRRGWLDLIASEVADDSGELEPRYLHAFLQASYDLTSATAVQAHLLYAADDVRFVDTGDGEDISEESRSVYGWVTVDSDVGDQARIKASVFHGMTDGLDDGRQINPPEELIFRRLDATSTYSGIESSFEYILGTDQLLRFGARHRTFSSEYDYDLDSTRRTSFNNNGELFSTLRDIDIKADGDDIGVFGSYRFGLGDSIVLEAGLRWDRYRKKDDRSYSRVSPRLNAMWSVGDKTELRFAWGVHQQPHFLNELDVIDGVTEWYAPEEAEHRIASLTHEFQSGLNLSLEAYDKKYRNLRPRFETVIDEYEFARESNFDRVLVRPSSGRAYGVEVALQRRSDQGIDWWFNYSWSHINDQVDGIDVPRNWDQRHAATAGVTWHG
ncbi:MAG: TonB-dependent receptor plug domain-containing protein, partial [Woeseiaceae bacterium]